MTHHKSLGSENRSSSSSQAGSKVKKLGWAETGRKAALYPAALCDYREKPLPPCVGK